jgi:hypothetical protein
LTFAGRTEANNSRGFAGDRPRMPDWKAQLQDALAMPLFVEISHTGEQ